MLRVDEILNLSREEMISSSKKFVASLCTQYKKNNYIDPLSIRSRVSAD